MKDEAKAVDEFLGDLNEVQEDPFKSNEEDPFTPNEKKEDVKEDVKEEKEEKPIPFLKDPKVQRYVDKQVEKALEKHKPSETQQFIKETGDDEITDVLTRIIGNDTAEKQSAIKDFRKVLIEREEKGAEKALKQFQDIKDAETAAEKRAQEELTQGFENIEETFGVDLTSNSVTAKKNKSEFVDFITKIAPKNSDGQVIAFPDLEASYEAFQERKKIPAPINNRAKELSARSMARSTDASAPQSKAVNWDTVDRLFSKD